MCGRHNISYHNPKSFIITSSSCKINSFSLIQTVLNFNFSWEPDITCSLNINLHNISAKNIIVCRNETYNNISFKFLFSRIKTFQKQFTFPVVCYCFYLCVSDNMRMILSLMMRIWFSRNWRGFSSPIMPSSWILTTRRMISMTFHQITWAINTG